MHVHSTFSDGHDSVFDNLEAALACGLHRIACVDRVRRDTPWVREFLRLIRQQRSIYAPCELDVLSGLETTFLDERGTLDLPRYSRGADLIYLSDDMFPFGDGCLSPHEMHAALADGSISAPRAIIALVGAMKAALEHTPYLVIARLFSILPKVGLRDALITDEMLCDLAETARECGALLEVSEKWPCPSPRVLRTFIGAAVPVVFSTDSLQKDTIGHYDGCAGAAIRAAHDFRRAA